MFRVWSSLWSDRECVWYLPIHLATDKVLISTALRAPPIWWSIEITVSFTSTLCSCKRNSFRGFFTNVCVWCTCKYFTKQKKKKIPQKENLPFFLGSGFSRHLSHTRERVLWFQVELHLQTLACRLTLLSSVQHSCHSESWLRLLPWLGHQTLKS